MKKLSDLPYPEITFLDPLIHPSSIALRYNTVAKYLPETNEYKLALSSMTYYVCKDTIVIDLVHLIYTVCHEDVHWCLYNYHGFSISAQFDNTSEGIDIIPERDKFVRLSLKDGWYDSGGGYFTYAYEETK